MHVSQISFLMGAILFECIYPWTNISVQRQCYPTGKTAPIQDLGQSDQNEDSPIQFSDKTLTLRNHNIRSKRKCE